VLYGMISSFFHDIFYSVSRRCEHYVGACHEEDARDLIDTKFGHSVVWFSQVICLTNSLETAKEACLTTHNISIDSLTQCENVIMMMLPLSTRGRTCDISIIISSSLKAQRQMDLQSGSFFVHS
jgi:hypothetical protein